MYFATGAGEPVWLCGLTFEVRGRRRRAAKPRPPKMYSVPVAGAWWRAVGAPLDRLVRPHLAEKLRDFACVQAPEPQVPWLRRRLGFASLATALGRCGDCALIHGRRRPSAACLGCVLSRHSKGVLQRRGFLLGCGAVATRGTWHSNLAWQQARTADARSRLGVLGGEAGQTRSSSHGGQRLQ